MKKYFLIILFLATASVAHAQTFEIHSFRLLANDITAWVNPVRDLNNEACALLKIVADTSFSFSTPLGIVKRKNNVGEVWLYIPNGSIQITIKHPVWGILRDYTFPSPLESRLSYELTISPPPVVEQRIEPVALIAGKRKLPSPQIDVTSIRNVRLGQLSPKPFAGFALLTAGIYHSKPSLGIFAAIQRKHGVFVHYQSNFNRLHVIGTCDENGVITDNNYTAYYSGRTQQQRYTISIGGVHHIARLFHLYEGIGFGKYTVGWETIDNDYLKNKDLSTKGIAAEFGVIIKIRKFALSTGILTIKGKHWEPNVGFGINI